MRALFLGLVTASLLVAAPAPPSTSDKVTSLIKQLSASDAREREAAQRALEELGVPAIEPLKKAALTGDADFARLANALAEKIRLATDRTASYAPTIVELNLKDTPLPDAIEALAKASGYPIRLADADKLKERKITLQTGKVPFWKAVDELCKKGNVSLVDGRTIRANGLPPVGVVRPAPGVVRPLPAIIGPGIRIAPKAKIDENEEKPAEDKKDEKPKEDKKEEKKEDKPAVPAPKVAPVPVAPVAPIAPKVGFPVNPLRPTTQEIVVVDQVPSMPASVAGAFYIRGLAFSQLTKAQQRTYDIALQIIGEPKFSSFVVTNVTVSKAVDELGQKRELTNRNLKGVGVAVVAPRTISSITNAGSAPVATYPLAFTAGTKEANELKEFVGSVSVQLRTAPSNIVTIKELAKDKQAYHAPTAVTLKLHTFEKNADGTYTVTADVFFPAGSILPDTLRDAPLVAAPAVRPVAAPYNASGLRLADKNGAILPLTSIRVSTTQDASTNGLVALVGGLLPPNERVRFGVRAGFQVTATFKPNGDEVPSQLLFRGSKNEMVDVPFELKNVPLK